MSTAPRVFVNDSTSPFEDTDASIEFERVLVVELQRRVLLLLLQHAVADDEGFDIAAHEAAEGVFRGAHDGLAAHVEAGVNQHRAAGALLECAEQLMKAGFVSRCTVCTRAE